MELIKFKLFEAADSAQNLHMTHADEDIFERGDTGAKAAIEFLSDFAKTVGTSEASLTVKWDGAPALFAGTDPEDGKFFIGTKSVFAKNPKLYKYTIQRTPLARWGNCDEVANLILFLLSNESSYITGNEIYIDGGWTAN